MHILDKILHEKEKEVASLPSETAYNLTQNTNSFLEALTRREGEPIRVITEVKKASPTQGEIRTVNPAARARAYENAGATAISCLTDKPFFNGSCDDLSAVSSAVSVPVIRKDFIYTKRQIAQARAHGAASFLLMVAVTERMGADLKMLIDYGRSLGMEPMVETHDELSIDTAVRAGARIIGVNCRNFEKEGLPLEPERFAALLPKIPEGIIRVAESGFLTAEDVARVEHVADAVLIGTALMRKNDDEIAPFLHALYAL